MKTVLCVCSLCPLSLCGTKINDSSCSVCVCGGGAVKTVLCVCSLCPLSLCGTKINDSSCSAVSYTHLTLPTTAEV